MKPRTPTEFDSWLDSRENQPEYPNAESDVFHADAVRASVKQLFCARCLALLHSAGYCPECRYDPKQRTQPDPYTDDDFLGPTDLDRYGVSYRPDDFLPDLPAD